MRNEISILSSSELPKETEFKEAAGNLITNTDKPVANPVAVLREEFDDWAVLFDPDSGNAFGLNPVGVFIWKHLNGHNTTGDILKELCKHCKNVPDDAEGHIRAFVQELVDKGLAGYQV
ncbi:MAG: SynChlorMet cassette protein ScmD [candidate division Zixibacteria bacterium]|nr:SynChlorMet cassette protein ScmD [candidate division Zixibacteria bacterium]